MPFPFPIKLRLRLKHRRPIFEPRARKRRSAPAPWMPFSSRTSDVRDAFDEGEVINSRVNGAFDKLGEIADKAEQFDLKGEFPLFTRYTLV